ncbi:hypothetical protein EVAR_93961_1 [Eumeta japonica]|uniref:Uncharacterized protein n=1 Tax=Eumeta variegata TaxID=151549 RepID=A0A4C1TP81_EUMVA|nr:hypothetical protein EVAR_93961_1 [Eumeta japonica]
MLHTFTRNFLRAGRERRMGRSPALNGRRRHRAVRGVTGGARPALGLSTSIYILRHKFAVACLEGIDRGIFARETSVPIRDSEAVAISRPACAHLVLGTLHLRSAAAVMPQRINYVTSRSAALKEAGVFSQETARAQAKAPPAARDARASPPAAHGSSTRLRTRSDYRFMSASVHLQQLVPYDILPGLPLAGVLLVPLAIYGYPSAVCKRNTAERELVRAAGGDGHLGAKTRNSSSAYRHDEN